MTRCYNNEQKLILGANTFSTHVFCAFTEFCTTIQNRQSDTTLSESDILMTDLCCSFAHERAQSVGTSCKALNTIICHQVAP